MGNQDRVDATIENDLALTIGAAQQAGLTPNDLAHALLAAGWRPPERFAPKKPLHPLGAAGLIAVVAGGVAALFIGDWRWSVVGAGLLFVVAAIGAAMDGRRG